MSFWLLIRRSLRFHARGHLGVVLGAAIGSAALIGALIVGDSVRGSLRARTLSRLGQIQYAMSTGDRFFRQELGGSFTEKQPSKMIHFGNYSANVHLSELGASPVLQLAAIAAREDGSTRANQVNLLGIEFDSWRLLARPRTARPLQDPPSLTAWKSGDEVWLNETLASQLGVHPGDEVILRIRKPSQLSQDAVINPREGGSLALRLKVGLTLPADSLGDFGLAASPAPPANAFLSLDFLSSKLELNGRANLILSRAEMEVSTLNAWEQQRARIGSWLLRRSSGPGKPGSLASSLQGWFMPGFRFKQASTPSELEWLTRKLDAGWTLEDAQLSVEAIEQPATVTGGQYVQPLVEVRSSRIFLEPTIVSAALKPRTELLSRHAGFEDDTPDSIAASGFVTNGIGILTYLANLIRNGEHATPYSMVTAAGAPFVPSDMRPDEILINEWLADDLQARLGDRIDLSYYAVDSASRLTERTNSFKVRGIIPLAGIYADRTLMPEFPGIAKAERTQDWDTGFPLTYKIREKDEAYWKLHRGTPKAFITLPAGQSMWSTRFGSLTAIRYQVPTNSSAKVFRDLAYQNLLANLDPAELGFRFEPVRAQALRAADQSQDFGQLFIGFSIFLVVSALLLMALLFQFGLDQRRTEVGTLLALGLRPKQVRSLLLGEAVVLALIGGLLGAAAGAGYAKAMLWALTTVWRSAVGTSALYFYASGTTWITGFIASTVVAVLTIWLALRKQARQPARELLAGGTIKTRPGHLRLALWIAGLSGTGGFAVMGYALARGSTADAEAFFEAGSLLLVAGLAGISAWLNSLSRRTASSELTFAGLGLRNCSRRRSRSLATVALLACGCFVIVSIGVFRLDANQDAEKRSSGTGGFALCGQSALPVVQDLNRDAGREFFGLSPKDFEPVNVVAFRVHAGDEASCLNLNRAQKPRLLGVKPELLAGRFTFAEVAKGMDIRQGWNLLQAAGQANADEIPAIGDANSIQWALGKSVGDSIDYVDELGRPFRLRLVGAVANSILQGSLIIDETQFVKKFPSESGHRYFLLDVPASATGSISSTLSRALQDQGLELIPAAQRLNAFNAVQNTYLGTFQILGGLGLLLGSAGLGVVVLRNVLERRGELALFLAVGFRKRALRRLVLAEHGALLGLGLGLGLIAAAVAVLPALLSPARELPYASLSLTLAAVLLNGALWAWLATRAALRGNLLEALRNE